MVVWQCVCLRILTHTLVISEDVPVFALVTQMTSEPSLALAPPCLCITHVVQRAALAAPTLLTLPTWLWGVTIVTQWTPLTIASLVARFTGVTQEITNTIQYTCGAETAQIPPKDSALYLSFITLIINYYILQAFHMQRAFNIYSHLKKFETIDMIVQKYSWVFGSRSESCYLLLCSGQAQSEQSLMDPFTWP